MSRTLLVPLLLALLVAVAFGAGRAEDAPSVGDEPTFVLQWSEPEAPGHPWVDVGRMICDEVYKRSNGRITIQHYPAAALGGQPEGIEMLRMGSLFMLTSGPSILNAFNEDVQIFSAPYLFRDRDHAYKTFKTPWVQQLLNEDVLQKSGVRTIAFWYYGDRHLTTRNRAVHRPEDLTGAKIRSMNIPVWKTVVAAMGANPTPVAYTELYMAMQTGVVEGSENPYTAIYAQKFYELQNYIIETGHVIHMGTIHVSEQIWQQLPEADRNMILAVFDDHLPVLNDLMDKKEAEIKDYLQDRLTIIQPDVEAFKTRAVREFMEVYESRWGDVIRDIQAIR